MGEMSAERTPLIIAVEINMIKQQTEKTVLNNFIEIGRRLTEAKAMLPYGEWGQWLKDSVSFSQSRADKLMRLYKAYGSPQPAIRSAGALAQAQAQTQAQTQTQLQAQELPDLSYTHALILLGVPEENRAQFISDMDIENMTTRELQKAVTDLKQSQQENADLRKTLDSEKEKSVKLAKEHTDMKTKVDALQKSKKELEQDVQTKTLENKKLKECLEYKSYQRVRTELGIAQIKLVTSKIAFQIDSLTKGHKELNYEMNMLLKLDKKVHDAYVKKMNTFLFKILEGSIGAGSVSAEGEGGMVKEVGTEGEKTL